MHDFFNQHFVMCKYIFRLSLYQKSIYFITLFYLQELKFIFRLQTFNILFFLYKFAIQKIAIHIFIKDIKRQ